jgi:hypothetical protein
VGFPKRGRHFWEASKKKGPSIIYSPESGPTQNDGFRREWTPRLSKERMLGGFQKMRRDVGVSKKMGAMCGGFQRAWHVRVPSKRKKGKEECWEASKENAYVWRFQKKKGCHVGGLTKEKATIGPSKDWSLPKIESCVWPSKKKKKKKKSV